MKNIKFYTLGGAGEAGKNMYCMETEKSIFVFDAGVMNPPTKKYGVELITVDPEHLIKNKAKVKAFIISHGHDDQMLGLSSILKQIKAPVYVNGIAKLILTEFLKKKNITGIEIKNYKLGEVTKIDDLEFEVAGVCHSLIDNSIIFGKIKDFTFVYATDFIFSIDESKYFTTDLLRLKDLASKYKPQLLIVSSLGSTILTQVSPMHKITSHVSDTIRFFENRLFFSLYEQNTLYTKEIIDAVRGSGKKLIIVGEMFKKIVNELLTRGVINNKGIIMGDISKIDDEKNAVVLIGESGTELFKRMEAIGKGEDPEVKLKPGDLFYNTAAPFDGSEVYAIKAAGEIIKREVGYTQLPFKQIIPAHASIEEIKQLINIIRPKYVIPVKGGWKAVDFFKIHISKTYPNLKILPVKNGDVISGVDGEIKRIAEIEANSVMIQTSGSTDIKTSVFDDRERMAKNGIVLIGAAINSKGEQVGLIDIQIRGLSLEDYKEKENMIRDIVRKDIKDRYSQGINKIRTGIRNKVQRLVMNDCLKKPQVLTIITTLRR